MEEKEMCNSHLLTRILHGTYSESKKTDGIMITSSIFIVERWSEPREH
jgi:hypothetical protein